jgi:hypothetical protein
MVISQKQVTPRAFILMLKTKIFWPWYPLKKKKRKNEETNDSVTCSRPLSNPEETVTISVTQWTYDYHMSPSTYSARQ